MLMRAFRQWEWFIKEALLDEMTDQVAHSATAMARPIPRFPHVSRLVARQELLRSRYNAATHSVSLNPTPRRYLIMHSPRMIEGVSRYWVANSQVADGAQSRAADIKRLMKLRHALAHGTQDARLEGRAVMLQYEPRRPFGSVGEFLSERDPLTGFLWLENVMDELCDVLTTIRSR